MKNLVIVESPAKSKTIEKFLGKDYTVTSSFGHIRDLPKKNMSIDIQNNFEPTYEVPTDKKKRVSELKKLAKDADIVWLATDEDREGEAIAWHLREALNIDEKKTKRIVFHEITKPAILKAIENPRKLDIDLVNAQQARRVLDRIVGYELSPVLWKKVQAGLSAGRVQSAAVRMIVEREREIEAFNGSSAYRLTAEFPLEDNKTLKAELTKKFEKKEDAEKFLKDLIGADFAIEKLETKPAKKSPAAPFTTSTLQQEASRKLSMGVKQTMMVAQKLYEAGKITYMRTDSLNLSDIALAQAAEVITKEFGAEYSKRRTYKSKSAGAQEAHEAIRPTDLSVDTAGSDGQEQRLYDLIRKRALASQMADAQLERTTATVSVSTRSESLVAKGEMIMFPGFLGVYMEGSDDEDDDENEGKSGGSKLLPPLTEGQDLTLGQAMARQTFTRPPARYTEASLVKRMEELGIGRPSTYAPTISTVQNRGYIEKGDREGTPRDLNIFTLKDNTITPSTHTEITGAENKKLFPLDIAMVVTDFLVKHFENVIDYKFTANVEEQFDVIAEGKIEWQKVLADFYQDFHPKIESSADISRDEASGVRELGKDPKTDKDIIVRVGRYGPMVQLGRADDADEVKPRFASLPEGYNMASMTLEVALPLFDLPRVVGKTTDGREIKANNGRFGPYVQVDKMFVSIKPETPFTITLKAARELITEKEKADAEKYITVWDEENIQVLKGRYGPYITNTKDKINAKIPKDVEPKDITLEMAKKLLAEAPKKKAGRFGKKAPAKKK